MPADSCALARAQQHEAPSKKADASPVDKNVKKSHSPYDDELERGSSEIQSQSPSARAHAGEVSRRTDRQTNAVPPPGPSSSGGRQSNTNSRRRLQGAAAPGGGFNSDSDSGDDERNGNYRDGGDKVIIRRRQQPAQQPPESHYEEQKVVTNDTLSDKECEMSLDRCMQRMLKFLETEMTKFTLIADQTAQQNELLRVLPEDERPGSISSEIYDRMLEYVDMLDHRLSDESVAAFRRHSARHSATVRLLASQSYYPFLYDRLFQNADLILKDGRLRYKYIEVKYPPAYAHDLCKLLDPPFLGYPSVFRVLLKDNKPMHAEPIDPFLLQEIGYKGILDYHKELLPSKDWWRYQRGNTELTRNMIFRVRMTGEVDGAWTSAEEDWGFINSGFARN